ncbi:MAG TPA: 1-(5-phosphoribosyl)-5-[(5-phosphoribosylamino)methylideneamino] imidazole-4-carboxamide isomerase [Bryobacteraceae bacterium]|nr:1-(5-phosphoribosyl)-5-[(5-phosphoribosylamino)methylideneamino] imidazole-4-carboxamide isomerase [Bryobacteraceae bacterium]
MLIPSIDLMGGKIVQLIQGSKKALEFTDFEAWIERFSRYSLVQLIDLDAAMGKGSNRPLVEQFAARLPCQVGGGIRSMEAAEDVLRAGARRIIIGSALIRDGQIDTAFAQELERTCGGDRLVFAVDSRGGKVAIAGWKQATEFSPVEMMQTLDPWCAAFLYTHIDTEGLMQGFPFDVVRDLRQATTRQLIVAGGIRSTAEIEQLDAMGADAVVGMALYTGLVNA